MAARTASEALGGAGLFRDVKPPRDRLMRDEERLCSLCSARAVPTRRTRGVGNELVEYKCANGHVFMDTREEVRPAFGWRRAVWPFGRRR
jgi:hypothetical protein